MIVSLAAVISLDGKITKHGATDIHSWVSNEDQIHFQKLLDASDAVIIGSNTYEMIKPDLILDPAKLRLVLTSRPKDYSQDQIDGQLEFMTATPDQTIDYLSDSGKQSILVAGGDRIMTDFLEAGLIDRIYITIEPKIFGSGDKLIADRQVDVELQLLSVEQLNNNGTLLVCYEVTKPKLAN